MCTCPVDDLDGPVRVDLAYLSVRNSVWLRCIIAGMACFRQFTSIMAKIFISIFKREIGLLSCGKVWSFFSLGWTVILVSKGPPGYTGALGQGIKIGAESSGRNF